MSDSLHKSYRIVRHRGFTDSQEMMHAARTIIRSVLDGETDLEHAVLQIGAYHALLTIEAGKSREASLRN